MTLKNTRLVGQTSRPSSMMTVLHDVAIIGAGPCGLAVAARLCEPFPSALFTDIEHARFWNRSFDKNTIDNEHQQRSSLQGLVSSKSKSGRSIAVFDAHSAQWMSSWRAKFQSLNISHLRSPLFFHPDPQDRDGLLAFSHCENRTDELREIQNVVGREISKHKQKKSRRKRDYQLHSSRHLYLDNRDQNDYFTPSSSLFDSYTDCIVKRYDLNEIIHHTQIIDLSYGRCATTGRNLFTITTAAGEKHYAQAVVLATGPVNKPVIPPSCPILAPPNQKGSAAHIFDTTQPSLPSHVIDRLETGEPTTIMIVGGGLTSAQIVDLLLSIHRVSKVYLVLRSRLKVKHFDVDLPWVAKLRNREMAQFWSANTDTERFEMLKAARNGGSITPGYEKILRVWEKKGRLNIHTESEIDADHGATRWDCGQKRWNVVLKTTAQHKPSTVIRSVDHIIFATSTPPNINNVSLLESFKQTHPIQDINGLPILTQDLMWREDVPLFVTGALAGLRLGPGAGNLAGARLGAERVAWGLEKVLDQGSIDDEVEIAGTSEARTTELRRDSGYASEDEISNVDKGQVNDAKKNLWNDYNRGVGSRFEGLCMLD